uniref:Uncharacterized protein n=1 Tax=Meloidogyne enterolobii TaxID=390850 RepID=A0A6V7WEQ8_MELEN|nr:unnamed protein product [Meloidogyne enterolobii]
MEGFIRLADLDLATNTFNNVELKVARLDPNYLLKMKIVIEIANNKFIKNFSPGFEKRINSMKKINDIVSIVTLIRRKNGMYTLRNTICVMHVTFINSKITEKIDQKCFGLKLKRMINIVQFAKLIKHQSGTVIQNFINIYVDHVTINNIIKIEQTKIYKKQNGSKLYY